MFKNLLLFYLAIILPIALLILGRKYQLYNSGAFVLGLGIYVFLYHPLISGIRLRQKEKITASDFWKNFIPVWNTKYFSALFFEK